MKTIVVTIWAYPGRPLRDSPLKQSCDRFGVPLLVLQEGERYVNSYENKAVRFFDEICNVDFDVLLWIDADDAFVTCDPWPGVLRAMEHYGADFLVGAEVLCWPWLNKLYDRFPKVARCNHPNAGVWVATKAALLREFTGMLRYVDEDTEGYVEGRSRLRNRDQATFQAWMTSGRSRMALDTQEQLALNLLELQVSEQGFFLDLAKGALPGVVHGAGPAKGLARRLWTAFDRLRDVLVEPRFSLSPHPALGDTVAGLVELLCGLPPLGRIAEVGCHRGVSTEVLALFADHLLAVDTWPDEAILSAFHRRLGRRPNVHAWRTTSVRAATWIGDESLDLVYIDADHSYNSVRQDIAAWLPKVRRGGFLTGHDYSHSEPALAGVVQAVNERFGRPHHVYADSSWLVQV